MQLIEIIQLVLVGFIVVSAIIFFISYILYRSKSTVPKRDSKPNNIKSETISSNENTYLLQKEHLTELDTEKKAASVNPVLRKKTKKKFEVFIPSKENTKVIDTKLNNSSKTLNNKI